LAAAGFSRLECIYSTLDFKKYSSQFYKGRLFPLESATHAHGVKRPENYAVFLNGGHLGFAVLDFLIFPKPSKSSKIDQKVIKINKRKRK